MEGAAKRKAASAAATPSESRPSKRQRGPGDAEPVAETADATTAMGLKFLDSLKAAKDKTGRPIAVHFLTLPGQHEVPGYYEAIKLPVAIDTIEAKLKRGGYASLAQVESDCKRLVNNAKSFNDKKTLTYEDAERLRKTASNWMVKHNPAYRDSNYVAVATPIPGEEAVPPGKPIPRVSASTPKQAATPTPASTEGRSSRRAAAAAQPATPAPSKLRQSASAAPDSAKGDSPGFAGKNFQQAQDQLLREIIEYVDPESGLQIFQPFINLPSRSLKDYYQLIKQPMSLQAVQKKVRGVIGRNPPTGNTLYQSWNALAQDISLIWINAREYNEDGSDIYNLSLEFEEIFKNRLEEAKANVEEPPQPKLKLNMSTATPASVPKQQLKLKLRQSPGSDPATPAGRAGSGTPGVIVDNEALLRQQRHVLESMNGGNRNSRPSSSGKQQTPGTAANPFTGPRGGSAAVAPLSATQTTTAGSPPGINGIKHDTQSPALNAVRPASTTSDGQRLSVPGQTPHPSMAPPQTTTQTANGSPHHTVPNMQQPGNYGYQPPNYYVPPSRPHSETLRKVPLKSTEEALIPRVTLNTHPALNLPKPWSATVNANKQKTSHSVTHMVKSAHSYLQIIPHVPIALTNRPYRIFVNVNGVKQYEVSRIPVTSGINGATMGTGYEGTKKKGEPVYEAKLVGGVNRIEVEIIAEKDKKGAATAKDDKTHVDIEKCTIFLNLMRSSVF